MEVVKYSGTAVDDSERAAERPGSAWTWTRGWREGDRGLGGRMRGAGRGEGKTERRGDWPEEGGEPGKAREAVQKGATRTSAGNAR